MGRSKARSLIDMSTKISLTKNIIILVNPLWSRQLVLNENLPSRSKNVPDLST